jgi:hypothetical protein
MLGVGSFHTPGQPVTLGAVMAMFCEFTTRSNDDLYDVAFNAHVTFHEVQHKMQSGSIGDRDFVGENDYPIIISRIGDNFSFGFYAFTTGDYLAYVSFQETAQYTDGRTDDQRLVRLLAINIKKIWLIPPRAFSK